MFLLDRGFYSESNIIEMNSSGIDFIIPLPFVVKNGKGMISETNRDVVERDIEIGNVKAYGYLFYNKKRESNELNSFFNRIIDIESSLEGKEFYGNPRDTFNRVAGNFARYFDWDSKDRVIHLKRRSNAISQAVNRFGKVILLSSTKRRWEEVLSLYRQRDTVDAELLGKNSIEDILLDLAKLRAIKIGSVCKLTEITKKERIVLEKMGVAIPIKLKHGY